MKTRKSIQSDLNILRNKMKVLAILLTVVAVALAQDTHFCPDNWDLHVRIFFDQTFKAISSILFAFCFYLSSHATEYQLDIIPF